jgi:hypothetical protein
MSEVAIIGVDLAKRVFQLHGAHQGGSDAAPAVVSAPVSLECPAQIS